jgi:2-iminobutanoate/2-iminopropanoate deaminase
MRKAFSPDGAVAVGPYSHAVESGDVLYLSGQTPIDPATGQLVEDDIEIQTRQCFKNLFAVLESAGLSQENVVKVNVFLTDMRDFPRMNAVYREQFEPPFPARSTIGVMSLPLGARVEIEMIARKG